MGDCLASTTEAARVGERLIVTLPCEATAGLRLSGEIAYRIGIGFGVRFSRMPESARAALALLLADYYRDLGRLGSHPSRRIAPRVPNYPPIILARAKDVNGGELITKASAPLGQRNFEAADAYFES